MTAPGPVSGMPVWYGFLTPVLEVLADGATWSKRDLHIAVFDHIGLTPEQLEETLPSGKSRADNRIGWALSGLNRAELVRRPVRATFVITDAGRQMLAAHPNGINEKILKSVPAYKAYVPAASASVTEDAPQEIDSDAEPLEQIEAGVARVHKSVAIDLLKRLRDQHPEFLEHAVLKLLVAMGYGGAEQRATRIGGTNDGGVDGVIDQDPLGLERIYVQAKRYAADNTVGREAIQAFVGALHGVGAARGVFITTSQFSQGARDYVNNISARVILIDGQRLTSLMIKYHIGVQVRDTFTVVEVDEDYFE
ncbi:restriction endonuclease [Antrihabitans spumae]|uniref:Restriction endonuclease n=2 Tax=Antrihabitans spumae TaxID=3373370 RepID=A0ABW7KES1_9NOCA